MNEVPLEFVREISVNIEGGGAVTFNIVAMREESLSVKDIESIIEEFLHQNDDEVENIEFHINIRAVADEVTGRVSKILDQ